MSRDGQGYYTEKTSSACHMSMLSGLSFRRSLRGQFYLLRHCISPGVFSSTCYDHLSIPFYWVNITRVLPALSIFTTKSIILCHEASFHYLGYLFSLLVPAWAYRFQVSLPDPRNFLLSAKALLCPCDFCNISPCPAR